MVLSGLVPPFVKRQPTQPVRLLRLVQVQQAEQHKQLATVRHYEQIFLLRRWSLQVLLAASHNHVCSNELRQQSPACLRIGGQSHLVVQVRLHLLQYLFDRLPLDEVLALQIEEILLMLVQGLLELVVLLMPQARLFGEASNDLSGLCLPGSSKEGRQVHIFDLAKGLFLLCNDLLAHRGCAKLSAQCVDDSGVERRIAL
mmetsp:Transcript_63309/g.147452  ORF Transcript_63309/g.147452 Transcript_63309/m.147452 type:complete len:200 (-) Transcript_63309:902-1501(-)